MLLGMYGMINENLKEMMKDKENAHLKECHDLAIVGIAKLMAVCDPKISTFFRTQVLEKDPNIKLDVRIVHVPTDHSKTTH